MKIKDIKKLILQTLKEVINTNKPKTIEEKRRKHAKDLHTYLVKQKRNHKTLSEVLEGPRTKFHPLLIKWQKINLKNAILNEQNISNTLNPPKTTGNADLSSTYDSVTGITPDEFADLTMDTQAQLDGECPCFPNCPSYGELTIYESGNCDHSIEINDGFICCSSNNPYLGNMISNIEFQGGNGGTQLMESGTSYCYHPDEGVEGGDPQGGSTYPTFPEGYQFTFDDLNTAAIHMWGMPNGLECDLPLFGGGACDNPTWVPGDGTVPDSYEGDYSGNAGCSVFGCAHPGATNYDPSAAGCQDPETSGIMTPGGEPSGTTPWYHCCEFQGCGASGTQPPANNVTIITSDVFDPIIGDESQNWFTDDGSCLFEYPCLNSYIIITLPDGVTQQEFPTQMGAGYVDTNGNEWDFEMPNAGIISSNYEDETYISNYDGMPAIQEGEEGCIVEVCANTNLLGIVDGIGNTLTTTYVIEEGNYTSYTVVNDPALCEIEACGPGDGDIDNSTYDNYVDELTFNPDNLVELGYVVNNQQDICEDEPPEPEVVNWNPDCSNLAEFLAANYEGQTQQGFDLSIVGDATTEDTEAYGWCGFAQVMAKSPFGINWMSQGVGTTDGTVATNQSVWFNCCPQNVTIYGCTNPLDNSGAYNELNEEELTPSTCVFEYCMYDPQAVSVNYNYPTNWVCFEYPELCVLTGTTDPCNVDLATLQADPGLCDEYTDENFGQWVPASCNYVAIGCMDSGGTQTWGDIGPFTTGVGTGINGAALNYSDEYEQICDETFGEECVEGPDGIMQQTTDPTAEGYNPNGCCCKYYPACTDEEAYNYVSVANAQDDGSCEDVIEGCMNPAFQDSYNPDANTSNIEMCILENECFDQGGVSGVGESTPSMWGNYICLDDTVIDTDNGPSTIGAELCNCGPGFCDGNEITDCNTTDCSAFSTLDTTLGTFIDGSVFNSTTGLIDYAVDNPGSCDGLDAPSCLADWNGDGNGSELYYYQNSSINDGEATAVEILNWNPYATTDDGSCEIFGCEDPNALNYFCNIEGNEDMCSDGIIMESVVGAAGVTVHPDFPCEYEANYDCNTWYNTDEELGETYGCGVNIMGEGTYSNLTQCEQNCYNCTYVWARLCNGTEEAEFECLQIDGKSGESNTSDPGLFFTEGDFFIIDAGATEPNVTYADQTSISQILPGDDSRKNVWEVIELSNTVVENVPYNLATSAECVDVVYGCMDETALNYNPDANVDDGSCEYPSECFDITALPCNMDKLQQCYDRAQELINGGLDIPIPSEFAQFMGMQPGYGGSPGERSWNCTDQQMGDYFFFDGFDCEISEGVEYDCTCGSDDDGDGGTITGMNWVCGIDYFNNNGDQQPLLSDIRAGLTTGTFGSAAYSTTALSHFTAGFGTQLNHSCCRPVAILDPALANYSWIYSSQDACNDNSACACNVRYGQNRYCNGNLAYDPGVDILGTTDPYSDPIENEQYYNCDGQVVTGWDWGSLNPYNPDGNSNYINEEINSSPADLLEQRGESRKQGVVGGPDGPSAIDDIGGGRDFPFDPGDPTNPCNCDPLPTQIDGNGDGVNETWCSYPYVSITSQKIPWQVTSSTSNTTTEEVTILPPATDCNDEYSSGDDSGTGGPGIYTDRDPTRDYATCGTRNNWCGTGNEKQGMRLNKQKKSQLKENKLRSFIKKTLNNLNK